MNVSTLRRPLGGDADSGPGRCIPGRGQRLGIGGYEWCRGPARPPVLSRSPRGQCAGPWVCRTPLTPPPLSPTWGDLSPVHVGWVAISLSDVARDSQVPSAIARTQVIEDLSRKTGIVMTRFRQVAAATALAVVGITGSAGMAYAGDYTGSDSSGDHHHHDGDDGDHHHHCGDHEAFYDFDHHGLLGD